MSFHAIMFDVCRQYCQPLEKYLPAQSLHKSRIDMQLYFEALNQAAKANQDPLWGFELGKQINTASYGLLGYFVESANTLNEALRALLSFDKTVANIGQCHFLEQGEYASIAWQPFEDNLQAVLRNMTAWVATVRRLTGQQVKANKVFFKNKFSYEQQQRLTSWFGCTVVVSATENRITFDKALLSLPILTSNELVAASVHTALSELQHAYDYEHHWMRHLQSTLHSCDLHKMSLASLAQALAMSTRTLQRHLKLHELCFSDLLEQERKRRFAQFCTVMSKQGLSDLLGYTEQASLNRAVKRWYGMSPSAYVKQLHRDNRR